jgi:hypothetical protein
MQKNNFYVSFAVWLIIIPLLGVPIIWRDTLVFLSGLFLLLVSLGSVILKKLQPKQKVKRKQGKTDFQNQPEGQSVQNNELRFSASENDKIETETEKEI